MTILFADNPDNSLKRKKRKVEYEKYQRGLVVRLKSAS